MTMAIATCASKSQSPPPTPTHPALLQEYLIERILRVLIEDCQETGWRCHVKLWPEWRSRETCLHTHSLAMCASVSHQWSQKAISILWGKYAGFMQLRNLVLCPPQSSARPENHEVEVMTSKQLDRCEYYCQYFKRLIFDGRESATSERLAVFETIIQIDKSAPLFPGLEEVAIPIEFTDIRGTYILLDRVASPKTRALRLDFSEVPNSALLSQYFAILSKRLLSLTLLSIWIFGDRCDERPHLGMSEPFQPESLAAFAMMTNLRTLNLDFQLISFAFLDVAGALPCLISLTIRGAVSTACNMHTNHNHQPRGSKFKSLEHICLAAPLITAKILFVTYFSRPPYSLREVELDLLDDNLTERDSLTFLEGIAKSLRGLDLCVGRGREQTSMGMRSLEGSTVCKQLTSLKITHSLFLSFQYPETLLLQHWQDITVLHLLKDGFSNVLIPDTPFGDVLYYPHFEEPDIYTLGFLADFLHCLTELRISLLACETSSSCDYNSPFKRLKELHLGIGSFVNFLTSGFSRKEGAEYIASLLPPDCTINAEEAAQYSIIILPVRVDLSDLSEDDEEEDGEPEWGELAHSHSKFMAGFTQQIQHHMSLRKDQTGIKEDKSASLSCLEFESLSTSAPGTLIHQ